MPSDTVGRKQWAACAAAAGSAVVIWRLLRYIRRLRRMPPKGPGLLERLQTIVGFSHKQVEWAQMYGPIYRTWDPFFGTTIHVADPEIMYDITVRVGNLYRSPSHYGRAPEFASLVSDTMGPSVTGMIGEEWRWRKDPLLRQFSNAQLLAPETGLLEAVIHEGELLCEELGKAADEQRVVLTDKLTTHAATGVMLFLMYGRRPAFDEEAFRAGSKDLMLVLKDLATPGSSWKMKGIRALQSKSQKVFDDVARPELTAILEEIKTGARSPGRKPCMMEALLKSEPRYFANGLDGLLAEARVFVNAGYETTAHSLAFTFGLLAEPQNSKMAELAREEAAIAMAAGLRRESLVSNTSYLDKVFHESLRLFPLAPELRGMAYEDFDVSVGDKLFLIPKGASFSWHIIAGQRCSRSWPDPDSCNPEHWSGDAAARKRLLAFNLGAHACPGKNLTHLEARVFLAMVLSRFRFELPEGVEKAEGYEEMLLRPKGQMALRVFRI